MIKCGVGFILNATPRHKGLGLWLRLCSTKKAANLFFLFGSYPSLQSSLTQSSSFNLHLRMVSLFSRFNPIPSFPDYTGPYDVGTIDVEIPTSELESPSPAPDPSISTIQFRIFYPCIKSSNSNPIRWLPNPQREYMSGYMRFLGANSTFAEIFSYENLRQLFPV